MKRFNAAILFIAVLSLMVLPGCSTLLELQGQGAKQAANGIKAYCKNTDENFRLSFRAEVNKLAAPHSAQINCVTE